MGLCLVDDETYIPHPTITQKMPKYRLGRRCILPQNLTLFFLNRIIGFSTVVMHIVFL